MGDLRCWLGGADRTSQFLWEGELLHGHQRSVMATSPCSQEERGFCFAQGSSLRNWNSALNTGKAAFFSSFPLAAGRKTQRCFCITNNQHSPGVLCAQGCSWCPTFGHCSWGLVISGLHRDWGLSRAGCGKVGSAHEHFRDEMKVVRFLMGTGGVYQVREWILAALQVKQWSWSLEPSEEKVKKVCCFSSKMLFPQAVIF